MIEILEEDPTIAEKKELMMGCVAEKEKSETMIYDIHEIAIILIAIDEEMIDDRDDTMIMI